MQSFYTYNPIVNIHEGNNVINLNIGESVEIDIPPGAYEIDEMNKAIQWNISSKISTDEENVHKVFSLKANNNILKCELNSIYDVDMTHENSIATLLRIGKKLLSVAKDMNPHFQ